MTGTFIPRAPLKTAVLFLVFNRPDTTSRVFEAIRRARPPRLYVAADGPRTDRADEAEKVTKVRDIATAVDWPCEVNTLFRDENLGCKYAVIGGITWFFEREERGIILEDDCLPSDFFFYFSELNLAKFCDNKKIFSINGSNHAEYKGFNVMPTDFMFADPNVWGWASWRDRWSQYEYSIPDVRKNILSVEFIKFAYNHFPVAQEIAIGSIKAAFDIIDTWDYPWVLSVLSKGGLSVTPRANLIENIGFGPSATHTKILPKKIKETAMRFERDVVLAGTQLNKKYLKAIHKRSFLSIIRNNFKFIYYFFKIIIRRDV